VVYFGLDAEEYDRQYSDKELLRKVSKYIIPHKKNMVIVIIFLILASTTSGIIPWLSSLIINMATTITDTGILIGLIIVSLLSNLTSWVFNWVQQTYTARVIANVVLDLQKDVAKSILNQDLSFFDKFPIGKIVSRVNSDTQNFGEMSSLLMITVSSFVVVFIIFVPMFSINLYLALILVFMIPVVFITALSFRKIARKMTLLGQRSLSVVNAFVEESMSGIQIAKSFRQEQKLYDQFTAVNLQSYQVNRSRALFLNLMFPILFLIQAVTIGILVLVGGEFILDGSLSAGDFYLFIQSLSILFFPLFNLASFWPQFQSGLAATERVFALIEAPRTVKQLDNIPLEIKKGRIEIENLKFSYNDKSFVFDNFNLNIKPGESVAIVGHTGAGKSTLAKLLGRFYEYQGGSIKIDGVDIREIDLARYREQIGFIPQSPFLFADTLENNVIYGKEANRDQIMEAFEKAGGSDWIEELPSGLDTNINERGKLISMGQRQLVAVARAFLIDPKILILDEATASVDPFTETRIQEALEKTMRGRTSIIIAHRLWTVRKVDRIVVFDHGKIVEEGNHDELMRIGKYYATLYNTYFRHQSYEFLDEIKQKASNN